jgi:hypothetical protein
MTHNRAQRVVAPASGEFDIEHEPVRGQSTVAEPRRVTRVSQAWPERTSTMRVAPRIV